jgi:hypothetical protein
MPNFTTQTLEDFDAYKRARDSAVRTVGDKFVPFVFSARHEFSKPRVQPMPLLVIESSTIDSGVLNAVRAKAKGAYTSGTCRKGPDGQLICRGVTGAVREQDLAAATNGVFRVVQFGEALPSGAQAGANAIVLDESKKREAVDVVRRQRRNLEKVERDLEQLRETQAKAKQSLETLEEQARQEPKVRNEATYKEAQKLAREAEAKALGALGELERYRQFLAELLHDVDKAPNDDARVQLVFQGDRFGEPLRALEGTAYRSMMATNDAVMLLGRTEDVWKVQLEDVAQGRALSVDPKRYSLPANDAFMKGGLDIKARFQLVTPLTRETMEFLKKEGGVTSQELVEYVNRVKEREPALWSSAAKAPAVSCREIGQLLDDGYWFGSYPKDAARPDGEMVLMMFPRGIPRQVKDELLREVTLRKAQRAAK